MRTILPGKPQAALQALDTVYWNGKRLIAYISGNAILILEGPNELIHTIYRDGPAKFEALAFDDVTGKIAVSCLGEVDIYKPYGQDEGAVKWSLESTISIEQKESVTTVLAWALEDQLLVARTNLELYETTPGNQLIWKRSVPNPVKLANFSKDGSMLVTAGRHDRLAKLWRRQAFGSDDTRFDFIYLEHPQSVTGVHWRKSHRHEHHVDNVLFTICADHKIRIWSVADPHQLHTLQFWAELDLQECLQPRAASALPSSRRFIIFIDSLDFAQAAEKALLQATTPIEEGNHALIHLREVAKTSPEVCIIVDQYGNMSAWGLENIGHNQKRPTDVFNIAHVEDFKLPFMQDLRLEEENVQFLNFVSDVSDYPFVILMQFFDGRIAWLASKLDELVDPSPLRQRFDLQATWTGHDSPIKKIIRSTSGRTVFSRTNDSEGLVWQQSHSNNAVALSRSSLLHCPDHIHRTIILDEGPFIVNLHHSAVSLWDASNFRASQLAVLEFHVSGRPLCLVQLPSPKHHPRSVYFTLVTSEMETVTWVAEMSPKRRSSVHRNEGAVNVRQYCKSRLSSPDEIVFILPIDPARSTADASSNAYNRDIVVSYTEGGTVRTWTASVQSVSHSVKWQQTSQIETGILNPSLASVASTRRTALVGRSKNSLTIWDQNSAQLEYECSFESHETIQDLDWVGTLDDQAILAVGFPYKVILIAQLRYDYLHAKPAWATIREINTKEVAPHPIGDSVWLGSGNLLVGAGNQLFIYDRNLANSEGIISDLQAPVHNGRTFDLFDLVTYLNGSLPVYHPQFIGQCILAGKLGLVHEIILALHDATNFFVDGERLDSFLSLPLKDYYTTEVSKSPAGAKKSSNAFADFHDDDEEKVVSEELVMRLNETLAKVSLPNLTSHDQIHLAGMIDCVGTAEKHRRSMDDLAMRFLLVFRQHMLRRGQDPSVRVNISWREIVWAFYSGSQDILVDLVTKQFQGRMLWAQARESGIFMWMTDINALRTQFEVIARNEYTKTEEKNPIHCTLYYLALRKKNVLLGLWRMASWNREQASTQRLLKNDFTEARWKTAALKNAYALISKRRFEYAAAFFLLADHLQDAVNLCAHQLEDLQLAIAIARVYDGDESPVLRSLLQEKILPQAALEGNRWLSSWTFWMLGRRDMALRSLVSPLDSLINTSTPPQAKARSYLSNDPALIVLYEQIRGKTLQTLKGAAKISTEEEWNFVLQNARVYRRMGCDLLALDLVRNWSFLDQPLYLKGRVPKQYRSTSDASSSPTTSSAFVPADPRSLLRRRSSLIVDDVSIGPRSPVMAGDAKAKRGSIDVQEEENEDESITDSMQSRDSKDDRQPKKREPTMFVEPDAGSLLDSFGF